MSTPEMRRLGYPHDFQPTITISPLSTFVPVDLLLRLLLTFTSTLVMPPLFNNLGIDSQLPQRLNPLLVRISTREVVCIAIAYQHACRRLAYEVLKRMLVRPGAKCCEEPSWAKWVRYQDVSGAYVCW